MRKMMVCSQKNKCSKRVIINRLTDMRFFYIVRLKKIGGKFDVKIPRARHCVTVLMRLTGMEEHRFTRLAITRFSLPFFEGCTCQKHGYMRVRMGV